MSAEHSQAPPMTGPDGPPIKGAAALPPGRIGMAIFLGSDVMGFGGLLLAYALLRTQAPTWPAPSLRFDRTLAGLLTALLLASSATMMAALEAGRAGRPAVRGWLLATAALGGAFVAGQAAEFGALATRHHLGLAADQAASIFYVLTGFHGLHVAVGVGILLAVARRPARERLEVVSLYWQFVELIWIVIFTVLYLLPVLTHG
jgi:heme/copper-type cytochrome/quinol oxidase subunit 3